MRKNLKKIATLAMAVAMAITVVPAVPTQAATTELIKNEWDAYFGASSGWAEGAEGALTENSKTSWTADMDSIGWGGIWGAQVKNENLKYQKGQSYTVSCKLKATNLDKWVLVKVEGEDPNAYEPEKAPLAFKWVQLQQDKEQTVTLDFTLAKNYSGHLSLYFGIGGEMGDREDEQLAGLYNGLVTLPKDGDPTFSTSVKCSNISVKQVATTIKKVRAKKGAAQVAINKSAVAKKYVVQYSTKKSMAGAKKVITNKTNATLKNLTSGKKYYVRVAVVNKNGKQSKEWSAKKVVKVK